MPTRQPPLSKNQPLPRPSSRSLPSALAQNKAPAGPPSEFRGSRGCAAGLLRPLSSYFSRVSSGRLKSNWVGLCKLFLEFVRAGSNISAAPPPLARSPSVSPRIDKLRDAAHAGVGNARLHTGGGLELRVAHFVPYEQPAHAARCCRAAAYLAESNYLWVGEWLPRAEEWRVWGDGLSWVCRIVRWTVAGYVDSLCIFICDSFYMNKCLYTCLRREVGWSTCVENFVALQCCKL